MRWATRSADMPGPGSRFGQDVTMRQRNVPVCARAGAAMAPAIPTAPARARLRRVIVVIFVSSPDWKLCVKLQRPVSETHGAAALETPRAGWSAPRHPGCARSRPPEFRGTIEPELA